MKKFFRLDKGMYAEFAAATVLFTLNILLTFFLPYFSEHKAYYSSIPYTCALIITYAVYAAVLFSGKKRSASDVALALYVFFALWEISYKLGWIYNDLLVPSPEGLFSVFSEKTDEILADVISSVRLLLAGFILAAVFGTLLGLFAGWIPRIRETLIPVANVITLIPPLMFSAYFIMIFSTFRQAATAVIFFAVFFPIFLQTTQRVGEIDPHIIEAAKTMGVKTGGMLFEIILPYCLPGIMQSISKSLRGAFMCLSGAEMLGINLGIGYFTEKYKSFADYRCVLAGIVTVGIITTLFDAAMNKAQKKFIKWKY